MRPFEVFKDKDPAFWAAVKYVSENIGYTDRTTKEVKVYSENEIKRLATANGFSFPDDVVRDLSLYSQQRANSLNDFVRPRLMTAEQAGEEYRHWEAVHRLNYYMCKLPMNKQKGDMKQVSYFTAIINILTEKTLRECNVQGDTLAFDDDPRGLTYIWDKNRNIIGASSRRFDGAYPSINNPMLVWEIKEYYYTTTFGSRIADGVYETQLDGFEFRELQDRSGRKVYHVLFVDAYKTWWEMGKSYLCRLMDTLNEGLVDEIIFGHEVVERWPELIREILNS